jgi:hypothetical protein
MAHPAQHIDQAVMKQKRVYFVGTASTTYRQGVAVAYNRDYGTAGTAEESRDKRVEPISQSNNTRFAGVLTADVTTDSTGEGWVTIYEPGGCAYIALGSDTTVNSTLLWFTAGTGGVGRWRDDKGTGLGRGAALALQTNASGKLGESIDGTAVVNGTAVVDTGLFTGAAAGDYLVIMASATAAGAAGATVGVYTISSVTDTANAVLTTSASAAASEFAGYVISGNPTCLAYLYDGEETGGIEWIESLASAASQSMVGGATHILGGVTLAGNATSTLADGTYIGERKLFKLAGALATSDYRLTVTTGNAAAIDFDADGDEVLLEWTGVAGWKVVNSQGPDVLAMVPGAGISPVTNSTYHSSITREGGVIKTEIWIDLTGLNSGGTAADIIGDDAVAGCHIGATSVARNGTIFAAQMQCLETPATADDDIDVYCGDLATGTEDANIDTADAGSATKLLDGGDQTAGTHLSFTTMPVAGEYMYLVGGTGGNATYSAGIILITLWGR